jgi:hypothetical protein
MALIFIFLRVLQMPAQSMSGGNPTTAAQSSHAFAVGAHRDVMQALEHLARTETERHLERMEAMKAASAASAEAAAASEAAAERRHLAGMAALAASAEAAAASEAASERRHLERMTAIGARHDQMMAAIQLAAERYDAKRRAKVAASVPRILTCSEQARAVSALFGV